MPLPYPTNPYQGMKAVGSPSLGGLTSGIQAGLQTYGQVQNIQAQQQSMQVQAQQAEAAMTSEQRKSVLDGMIDLNFALGQVQTKAEGGDIQGANADYANVIKDYATKTGSDPSGLPHIFNDPSSIAKLRSDIREVISAKSGKPVTEAQRATTSLAKAQTKKLEAETALLPAEALIKKLGAMAKAGESSFKQENTLRENFTKASSEFVKADAAYNRIEIAAEKANKDKSPAAGLALIFGYMKMLDPMSVVRESEFENAATSRTTLLGRLMDSGNITEAFAKDLLERRQRLLEGVRLGPEQVNDFLSMARGLYERATSAQSNIENQYKGLATQYGLQPNRVIIDYRTPSKTEPKPKDPSKMTDEELLQEAMGAK